MRATRVADAEQPPIQRQVLLDGLLVDGVQAQRILWRVFADRQVIGVAVLQPRAGEDDLRVAIVLAQRLEQHQVAAASSRRDPSTDLPCCARRRTGPRG